VRRAHAAACGFAFATALIAATAAADRIKSQFTFKVPAGWTDESSRDTREFYVLASHKTEHLNFQAKVSRGGDAVTPEFLERYADSAQKSVAKYLKGAELKVLKKEIVQVAGTTAARFVFELPPPAEGDETPPVRQLQYYIPAKDQHAVLTFSGPVDTFDKFVPLFDKTAGATVVHQ
jgi:hypothetical protein